jgi:hypothetical protein
MKKKGASPPVFALGHSTRPREKFVAMLRAHTIDILVDIRTVSRSRRNR